MARRTVREQRGEDYLPPHPEPVEGHRVDIVLDSLGARQAVCQCGFKSGFWSTARLAVDRWRLHAGLEVDE